ncbi:hypothetical protein D1872_250790 [compost metagenome]
MSRLASNRHLNVRSGRGTDADGSYFAIRVQGESEFRIEILRLHRTCTNQTRFLAHRDHKLNLTMWKLLLLCAANGFE